MPKTVPLSVRVTQDDAEFISRLEIAGAATPSDKVRALLADARKRQDGFRDYPGCLAMVQEILGPMMHQLREAEHREEVHSELVLELTQWMPETLAFLLTSLREADDRDHLQKFEQGVAERLFRLLENVLRMAVTSECHGYDREVVRKRMPPVIELVDVIRKRPND
jgi:hypothetical protein